MADDVEKLARLLADNHTALLATLTQHLAARPEELQAPVLRELGTALNLLSATIANGPAETAGRRFAAWLKIAGEKYPGELLPPPALAAKFEFLLASWMEILSGTMTASQGELITMVLGAAASLLETASERTVRVLFVGDCLLWDASLELQLAAYDKGIRLEPSISAQRLPAELRMKLLARKPDAFDFIIYSPFTYEFSPGYAYATSAWAMLKPRAALRMIDEATHEAEQTIDLMASHFECPIYVHRPSGVLQSPRGWRGWAKSLASLPNRRFVARRIDRAITRHVIARQGLQRSPVLFVDEHVPDSGLSERELGAIAFNAGELHPTRLALELARGPYLRAMRAACLAQRKIVICDLDNTLWDGLIGENTVRHYHDRQNALKSLRSRGIVLAIASKNDPANVHWTGASLCEDDFVASYISWQPKATSVLAIAEELNLKPSSFLFLDDRADERAMVEQAAPGLLALDPEDPETWHLLELWAETLPPPMEGQDRTQTYQARSKRQDFLNSIGADDALVTQAYEALNLRLLLRHPAERDMPRVVELINRTNQFNTTNARTSRRRIDERSETQHILVAELADKFGNMGIVGILVAASDDPWRITHFVLSCRVFGYGVEDAMLNALKLAAGPKRIEAEIVETASNGPCRDVYERNGFCFDGTLWSSRGKAELADVGWLNIENHASFPRPS